MGKGHASSSRATIDEVCYHSEDQECWNTTRMRCWDRNHDSMEESNILMSRRRESSVGWHSGVGAYMMQLPKLGIGPGGGLSEKTLFLLIFRFLSNQEVPGCHKNIYRELRPSFTRSQIFGNMCCFFRQQTQHLLPSWGPGSPKGSCGNPWEKSFFHFSIRKIIFRRLMAA